MWQQSLTHRTLRTVVRNATPTAEVVVPTLSMGANGVDEALVEFGVRNSGAAHLPQPYR